MDKCRDERGKVKSQFRIASNCAKKTEIGIAHSEFVPTAFKAQSFRVLHSVLRVFFLGGGGAPPPHHSSTFVLTSSSRELICHVFPVRARSNQTRI
jgi:hypothetical protein